jgi:uncharacterized protein
MSIMKSVLNLFFKYPEFNMVKTRLARDLDGTFVFDLYREFIKDIIDTGKKVDAGLILSISSSGGTPPGNYEKEFGIRSIAQSGQDLGERMYNSFNKIFSFAYRRCLLIGSDIPDISAGLLNKAFDKLNNYDIILGPSSDGGYYLIGLNSSSLHREIFKDVRWGTGDVLEKTMENTSKLNLKHYLLDELNDIDSLHDLRLFYDKNKNRDDLLTVKFLKNRLEEFYGEI